MRFEFTIKDLEVETFRHVSQWFIEDKIKKYAGQRIGVYDYSIACEDNHGDEYTVVFRILKPRYQIVVIDRIMGRQYINDYVYTNLHDATFKCEQLMKEQSTKNIKHEYEIAYKIEPIYYLDHKI